MVPRCPAVPPKGSHGPLRCLHRTCQLCPACPGAHGETSCWASWGSAMVTGVSLLPSFGSRWTSAVKAMCMVGKGHELDVTLAGKSSLGGPAPQKCQCSAAGSSQPVGWEGRAAPCTGDTVPLHPKELEPGLSLVSPSHSHSRASCPRLLLEAASLHHLCCRALRWVHRSHHFPAGGSAIIYLTD